MRQGNSFKRSNFCYKREQGINIYLYSVKEQLYLKKPKELMVNKAG